jgi:ABC-type sulfate transport system substrate-binding protein
VSLRRDFIKIPFAAALAAALNPAALPSNTQPALTLLNVSYDPTRELDVAKADKEQFADGGSFDQIYTRN